MGRFSSFGFPYQYYNPYRRNTFNNNYKSHIPTPDANISHTTITEQAESCPPSKQERPKLERSIKQAKSDEAVWLDLFGIKLFFDDVLILSLLFFLYKEEVKDEGLFLALVMLLIS